MKSAISGLLTSSLLIATAVAQTSATTQTSGSASSQSSVSASQSGANANTNNSANASQDANVSRKGKSGNTSSANANGAASQDSNASLGTGEIGLPAGTRIPAVLNKSVDSKKAKAGDEVTATTAADVLQKGKVIVPRNTKLIGHVTEAKAKANGESESALGIAFDKAVFKNGRTVPLNAGIQALAAPAAAATSSLGNDTMAGGGGGMSHSPSS